MNSTDLERFITKYIIDPATGCWNWTAYKNSYGYGVFRFNGGMGLAHRFSFEKFKRNLKTYETVDHLCFNRACVNPAHLDAKSHQDNVARSTERFRQRTQCKYGHALNETSIYVEKSGAIRCKICTNIKNNKWKQKSR